MYVLNATDILVWEDKKVLNIDYSGNDLVTILDDDLNF
jgi:urease accessory protein UreE